MTITRTPITHAQREFYAGNQDFLDDTPRERRDLTVTPEYVAGFQFFTAIPDPATALKLARGALEACANGAEAPAVSLFGNPAKLSPDYVLLSNMPKIRAALAALGPA